MSNPEYLRARDHVVTTISEVTTAKKVLNRNVYEPKNYQRGLPPTNIASSQMIIIREQMENGTSVYTAPIKDRLSGQRLNQVYWEIAPSDNFGLDRQDYISDHTRLLLRDPNYERIRLLHEATGKPWKIYKRYGLGQLTSLINEQSSEGAQIIPVIRWSKNPEGKRQFIYSPLMHSDQGGRALEEFVGDLESTSEAFDPALGLCILALFSRAQRKWPQNASLPNSRERGIGSTQVPLYVLMREADLLKSPFLRRAEAVVNNRCY